MSNSRLGQLLREYPLQGVQADKIDDLALGLGVSRDRVAVAVIQAMGFRISDGTMTPAEAIAADTTLSEYTKHALLAILRMDDPAERHGLRQRGVGGGYEQRRPAPIGDVDVLPAGSVSRGSKVAPVPPGDLAEWERQLRQQLEDARTRKDREHIQSLLAAVQGRAEELGAEQRAKSEGSNPA